MLTAPDRRATDRRSPASPPHPRKRKAQRRHEDRRDATRVPRLVTIVDCETGNGAQVDAVVSLEGVSWVATGPQTGDVEVVLRLPDMLRALRIRCTITRLSRRRPHNYLIHAKFPDLDVKSELGLARFLDARARLEQARRG